MTIKTVREILQKLFGETHTAGEFKRKWDKFTALPGHTVKMKATVRDEWKWLLGFVNCYAYALRLNQQPRYQSLIFQHGTSAVPNAAFVKTLIANGMLKEIVGGDPPVNAMVLYFSEAELTHAGIILSRKKRVRSKWGPNEVFEHSEMEVQTSFGNATRYFEPPSDRLLNDILNKLWKEIDRREIEFLDLNRVRSGI